MKKQIEKIILFIGAMDKSGGVERVTANLANMWIMHGYQVDIVVLERQTDSFFQLDSRINVLSLNLDPYEASWEMPIWYMKMTARFRSYLKHNKNSCVFGIWTSRATAAVLAAAFLRIPVVACEHIAFTELRRGLRILRKYIYPHVNAVVSLTKHDAVLYQQLNNNVYVIPNSVETVSELPTASRKKIILAVGRLVPQKGFDLLLRVWENLYEKYPDWRLKIVGRSLPGHEEYTKKLYSYNEKHLQGTVVFQDQTKDIINEYDNCGMFVLSSRFEGLPMVLLEAMSRGVPVISFDCPTGPRDVIVNGVNGTLVENGNLEAMRISIEKNINDSTYREKVGKSAHEFISQYYAPKKIEHLWVDLLNSL